MWNYLNNQERRRRRAQTKTSTIGSSGMNSRYVEDRGVWLIGNHNDCIRKEQIFSSAGAGGSIATGSRAVQFERIQLELDDSNGKEFDANDIPAWPDFNACDVIGLHHACAST
jgi:hypothetical protein